MHERYFLKLNGVITGPFKRQQLLQMLKNNSIKLETDTSVDKQHFYPLHRALNLIMLEPAASPAPPQSATLEQNIEADPETPSIPVMEINHFPTEPEALPPQDAESISNSEVIAPADDRSVMRIIADTLGSLGNGSGYLLKLFRKGSGAMIGAGMLALFLSITMTILSGVLFASRYDSLRVGFYMRSIVFVLLSGGVFWLFNLFARLIASEQQREFCYEADFLSAMHGMMNMALLTLLAAGSFWLFKNDATVLAGWNVYAVKLFITLILGFFLFNLALSLRVNFFDGCSMGAGWASFWSFIEISLALILWSLIAKPIYI